MGFEVTLKDGPCKGQKVFISDLCLSIGFVRVVKQRPLPLRELELTEDQKKIIDKIFGKIK